MVVSCVSLPKFGPSGPLRPIDHLARRGGENIAFAEWAARGLAGRQVGRIAELQTERGVAGIGFLEHQQVMRLRAHVAGVEHGVVSEAALDREHVFLGVGNLVVGRHSSAFR